MAEASQSGKNSVITSPDTMMKIITEYVKLGSHESILSRLSMIARTCRTWRFILNQDELWYLLFRSCYPRASAAKWLDPQKYNGAGWRTQFQALAPIVSVILWVEDDPSTVQGYACQIRQSPARLHHVHSTREAKTWLTTNAEALHPSLHIITDNVREEEDADGRIVNNFNAGRELVEWLQSDGAGFGDAPTLIFCGSGSIPYIQVRQRASAPIGCTVQPPPLYPASSSLPPLPHSTPRHSAPPSSPQH
jgi:hypothetical protein